MIDCRDCKWVVESRWVEFDVCRHRQTSQYAENAREYECGPNAEFFEPKPPTAFRKLVNRILDRPLLPAAEFDFESKTPEMYSWQQ